VREVKHKKPNITCSHSFVKTRPKNDDGGGGGGGDGK
jgi:hypothetical protein